MKWYHHLWRYLPASERRKALAWGASLAAPRIAKNLPAAGGGIILAGEFSRASGLGECARLLLSSLQGLDTPVWPFDVGPLLPAHRDDMPPPSCPMSPPPHDAALVLAVNPPLLPIVLARMPRSMTRARRIIGVWNWELPVAPALWRPGARFVHEVWVPSKFTADALAPLSPGPVRVVPYPLADSPQLPSHLGRADFGLPDDAVMVLASFNLASSFERKNPLATIAAFRAAFGIRTDRILVMKVGNPDHFPADFALLTAAIADAPNIRLETRTFPPADSLALLANADIVISLHRSEGFGLVPAEAMLLGRPVVATGWSGNMQFMDDQSARLVPYRLVPAWDPRGTYDMPGAVWAETDIAHATASLRQLADDASLRRTLGEAGREMAKSRLGIGPLVEACQALRCGVQQ